MNSSSSGGISGNSRGSTVQYVKRENSNKISSWQYSQNQDLSEEISEGVTSRSLNQFRKREDLSKNGANGTNDFAKNGAHAM